MSILMSYMVQNFMQKGLGCFLGSGGNDKGSINSALSQLQNRTISDPDNPLIPQVKSNGGLQDNNQTQLYTQQALGMMQEHANNNPQGLHSMFGNVANSKGFDLRSMLSALGSSGSSTNQQQQQKKQGGIGELLGKI